MAGRALKGIRAPRIHPTAWVAPNAVVCGDVEVGERATVWFGAVLRAEEGTIRVGARSNVQDNTVVHVSAGETVSIGEDVTVGHACIIHGCTVRDRCIVGMGSILMDGCDIGEGCMVGAGTLVTVKKAIPPGSVVLGRPGKAVKPANDVIAAEIKHSAELYVQEGTLYRESGIVRSKL